MLDEKEQYNGLIACAVGGEIGEIFFYNSLK